MPVAGRRNRQEVRALGLRLERDGNYDTGRANFWSSKSTAEQ